jgi:hypothetical protein
MKILTEYGKDNPLLTAYDVDASPEVAGELGGNDASDRFLLDAAGTIRQVNNGVVRKEDLRKQLELMMFQRRE